LAALLNASTDAAHKRIQRAPVSAHPGAREGNPQPRLSVQRLRDGAGARARPSGRLARRGRPRRRTSSP
jgi:hypothetical protein